MTEHEEFNGILRKSVERVHRFQKHLTALTSAEGPVEDRGADVASVPQEDALRNALEQISPALAASYCQVKVDLEDVTRTSWAGAAHEIREIVATLLRLQAPDAEVIRQPWYRQEPNTSGPTQKQRVRYILQQQGAGSKQREVVQEISVLEERIGDLVRATYSRASDAAHRMKGRTEAVRVFRYFEAFAHDLLNL